MRKQRFVASALFAGLLACGASNARPWSAQEATLTPSHPAVRVPITRAVLENPPPILEVPVTRVANPHLTPFALGVYFAWKAAPPGMETQQKLRIGSIGVFPANRPGRYTLRASRAFEELRRKGVNLAQSRLELLFLLEKVREKEAWTPLQITLGPPRWQREPQP